MQWSQANPGSTVLLGMGPSLLICIKKLLLLPASSTSLPFAWTAIAGT